MRKIERETNTKWKDEELLNFVKRSALETDCKELIKEDVEIWIDGELAIVYCHPDWDFEPLRNVVRGIHYPETIRTGGLKTRSRVFGYQPRVTLRRDFCTATSLRTESPEKDRIICEYGVKAQQIYKKHFPDVYQRHQEWTDESVKDDWKIEGAAFTSGIVNKNNPLKYHFDAGNIKDVKSCMIALKKNVGGGYLAIPEVGLMLEIADSTLSIFDGQSILHGVTPIKNYAADAYRYTTVYYTLQQMWKCEPLTEELARIRMVKTERERKRARNVVTTQHGEEEGEV